MPTGRPKDPSRLSTKPSQIRRRIRRNGENMMEDIQLYGQHKYGKRIEDWDLEELARGRPRDAAGGFRGPAPKWLAPAVMMEAKRRLIEETYGLLSGHVSQAVKVMGNLLVSEEYDMNGKPIVDAKTKFAAAAFIIEHFIGKPKQFVELTESDDRNHALAAAILLDDGKPQGHLETIEGHFEVIEDDEVTDDA